MADRATLEDILSRAVNAPSGDNAQPWEFKIENDSILIFNLQGRDATLYNFRERGSFLSHGALIENISVIANSKGLAASVELLPKTDTYIARVNFSPTQPTDAMLAHAIENRVTNRKPYKKIPFDSVDKQNISDSVKAFPSVELRFVEGVDIQRIAEAISANEQLLFENEPLHDFLFSMIRWTKKEEDRKAGLYVMTMEFPLPLRILLKYVFSRFQRVLILNKLGLSKAIPKQSAAIYSSSSAIGALIMKSDSDANFIMAGRAFERMWLTLTARGLWLQPVAAIPYLMQRVDAGEVEAFSVSHIELIRKSYGVMSEVFSLVPGEHIMMMFRIGYGEPPTAKSAKLPPVIRQ